MLEVRYRTHQVLLYTFSFGMSTPIRAMFSPLSLTLFVFWLLLGDTITLINVRHFDAGIKIGLTDGLTFIFIPQVFRLLRRYVIRHVSSLTHLHCTISVFTNFTRNCCKIWCPFSINNNIAIRHRIDCLHFNHITSLPQSTSKFRFIPIVEGNNYNRTI